MNTILIIAFIAVLTVSQPTEITKTDTLLLLVVRAIFCLNFAVNPLVYCLRLKRYRETFKIVYGCKYSEELKEVSGNIQAKIATNRERGEGGGGGGHTENHSSCHYSACKIDENS